VNLDLATEQVIEARAQTGIAMSRFEAAFNVNEFMQERVPAYLADIQDADMTEAIAELQLTSTALEATLSATGKVLNGPSLLDYLR
jgi:flagellin-like hook-associated protein FlgL